MPVFPCCDSSSACCPTVLIANFPPFRSTHTFPSKNLKKEKSSQSSVAQSVRETFHPSPPPQTPSPPYQPHSFAANSNVHIQQLGQFGQLHQTELGARTIPPGQSNWRGRISSPYANHHFPARIGGNLLFRFADTATIAKGGCHLSTTLLTYLTLLCRLNHRRLHHSHTPSHLQRRNPGALSSSARRPCVDVL